MTTIALPAIKARQKAADMSESLPGDSGFPGRDKVLALLQSEANRRVVPNIVPLQREVETYRAKHNLQDVQRQVDGVTKSNRVSATRGATYSLIAAVPGLGTALAVTGLGPGLAKLLKESVEAGVKVGLAYGCDLGDERLRHAAVLAILSTPAKATTLWGRHERILLEVGGFASLTKLEVEDLYSIIQMQDAILSRWVGWVGSPFVTGLAPYGIGAVAVVNWIQYVMKTTISAADLLFRPTGLPQRGRPSLR